MSEKECSLCGKNLELGTAVKVTDEGVVCGKCADNISDAEWKEVVTDPDGNLGYV